MGGVRGCQTRWGVTPGAETLDWSEEPNCKRIRKDPTLLSGFAQVAKALVVEDVPLTSIGAIAEVREPLDPSGQVFIQGALWHARTTDGGEIGPGNRVRVKAVDGLTLEVEPVPDQDPATVEKGA